MTPFQRWYRRNFGYNAWLFFWPLFGSLLIVWFIATFIRFPATFLGAHA